MNQQQQLNNQVATTLIAQINTLRSDALALLRSELTRDMSIVALEELSFLTRQLQVTSDRLRTDFKRTGYLSDDTKQT